MQTHPSIQQIIKTKKNNQIKNLQLPINLRIRKMKTKVHPSSTYKKKVRIPNPKIASP